MPSPLALLKNNDLALSARSLFLRRPRGSGITLHIKMVQNCNITFAFGNKPGQLSMIDNRAIVKLVQQRKMQKCTAFSRDWIGSQ